MTDGGSAPAWLFSFVDLAFLLMIAMTQLAGDPTHPELGAIVVPRIEEAALATQGPSTRDPWQLRVHPPSDQRPFELVRGTSAHGAKSETRLSLEALRARLEAVKTSGQGKPMLAPHEDSRSQDLLDALAALEIHWPGHRRAVVSPTVAAR